MLIEVEDVLNGRPITYVYENEIEELSTSSHLFCGQRLLSKVNQDEIDDLPEDESFEANRNDVVAKLKKESSVIEHFLRRWYKEYIWLI